MTTVDSVLSVEQLLAKSAEAVKTGKTTAGMSTIEKMLAEQPAPDIVDLSPVARVLAAREQEIEARSANYEESDEFLEMKARELSRRLQIYSRIPGMEAVYEATEKEATELIQKIADRQKEVSDNLAAKQKELEEARANESTVLSPEELLKRARGESTTETSDAAEALLKKVRGATVNTSA